MKILALDTSTASASLALLVEERGVSTVRATRSARVRARHGETLLPHVEALLVAGGLSLAELDLLAVGVGPGSFTGTRIGLATAKGLALAAGLPIVGVESLAALAYDALPRLGGVRAGLAAALIDASRGAAYGALYRFDPAGLVETLLAPFEASPADAEARLRAAADDTTNDIERPTATHTTTDLSARPPLPGQTLPIGGDLLAPAGPAGAPARQPRAESIAALASARFAATGPDELATLEPVYVRESDATPQPAAGVPPGRSV